MTHASKYHRISRWERILIYFVLHPLPTDGLTMSEMAVRYTTRRENIHKYVSRATKLNLLRIVGTRPKKGMRPYIYAAGPALLAELTQLSAQSDLTAPPAN